MTTLTAPAWARPKDLDLLEHTGELLELRDRLERAERAFDEVRARPAGLTAERDRLEREVLDGDSRAGRRLAELNVRLGLLPTATAEAADDLAGTLIDWCRYVVDAAEDVRAKARADEKALNHANRLDRRHLYHGSKEIPGAREEIQQAVAESQPLRDRQAAAHRLARDARLKLRRVLGVRGNGRLGPAEVAEARRKFIERARAEAAAEVISR